MANGNLERAERRALSMDAPVMCPSCGAEFGVDVETADVELGERDSLGSVSVHGRAGCTGCGATWRFSGPYRPYDFRIDMD